MFVFDGFGNLTQPVLTKGSAPSMTLNVNPANNQVTGSGITYDAAGNLTSMLYGGNMTYDLASRLASVQGMPVLRYTARNERLVVNKSDGTREVHMRGLGGEMIGVYRIDWENGNSMYTKPVRLPERERVHVAGRLLFEGGKFVATDRLGSVVYKFGTGLAVQNGTFESGVVAPWAPYGEAQISTSTVAHTGVRSLRLTTTVADRGAYQDVKGVVAGMMYQFQVWVRAETGTNTAALAVCDPVGGGFVWTGPQTITTDWRLLTVYFTATSNGTARIILAKYDTTGALLWDDVELVNGATATSGLKMRYYPYGQEVGTATANDVAKFGTYTRDAGSGLDYAMNRYYQSWWGRFTTADPYRASGGPGNPGSWNRYSYVQGDPVNYFDPLGLQLAGPGFCSAEYTYEECMAMGYISTGGGGGGPSLIPWIGMPWAWFLPVFIPSSQDVSSPPLGLRLVITEDCWSSKPSKKTLAPYRKTKFVAFDGVKSLEGDPSVVIQERVTTDPGGASLATGTIRAPDSSGSGGVFNDEKGLSFTQSGPVALYQSFTISLAGGTPISVPVDLGAMGFRGTLGLFSLRLFSLVLSG